MRGVDIPLYLDPPFAPTIPPFVVTHPPSVPPSCHQLVERALQTLASRHNPTSSSEPSVGVVRISGLLHLEERAAFQEIARQLCLYAGDGGGGRASHRQLPLIRCLQQQHLVSYGKPSRPDWT